MVPGDHDARGQGANGHAVDALVLVQADGDQRIKAVRRKVCHSLLRIDGRKLSVDADVFPYKGRQHLAKRTAAGKTRSAKT